MRSSSYRDAIEVGAMVKAIYGDESYAISVAISFGDE
jgi:hypothetical protein